MPKNTPPSIIIIPVASPTIPKKGVSGIRVKTSDANAAYNPITDQYMKVKCLNTHVFVGFLVQIGTIPRVVVTRLATVA